MIQVGRNSEHGTNPILTTCCYLKCFANSIGYIPGYRIFHQAQAPPRLCSGFSDHPNGCNHGRWSTFWASIDCHLNSQEDCTVAQLTSKCGVSLQAQRQSKSARETGADAQAPDLFDPFCFTFAVRSGVAHVISWKIHFLHLGHHQGGFGRNKSWSVKLLSWNVCHRWQPEQLVEN